MKYLYCFCLVSGFLFLSVPVWAQQEEGEFEQLLQEFSFTQAVYPQEQKELQLTLAGFLLRSKSAHDLDLGFGVEYGLTDRLQVEAEIGDQLIKPRYFHEITQRNSSFGTGLLYNWLNRPGISGSIAMDFEFPLQNKEDSMSLEYQPRFIIAKQMGKGQVHLDMSVSAQKTETEYFYNLAYVYPIGGFKPVLELNGSYEDDYELSLSPGLVWNGHKNIEIVTGATFGIWQKNAPWGISLKFIYEFSFDD